MSGIPTTLGGSAWFTRHFCSVPVNAFSSFVFLRATKTTPFWLTVLPAG
jgi:hypothetical protein